MKELFEELASWSCILIPLALVVIGFVVYLVSINQNHKDLDSKKEKQNARLLQDGVTNSVEYDWRNAAGSRYYRVIVDDLHRKLYILQNDNNGYTIIPFSKISGFEVFCDNKPADTLKRVVKGGLLYGASGAFIGASTARDKVRSFRAVIYLRDIENPRYVFDIIQKDTSLKSSDYISAVRFAEQVKASVLAIVEMNSTSSTKGY